MRLPFRAVFFRILDFWAVTLCRRVFPDVLPKRRETLTLRGSVTSLKIKIIKLCPFKKKMYNKLRYSCPCRSHKGVPSRRVTPPTINPCNSYKWIHSVKLRPLYPWGKIPRYLFNMRLNEPHSWSRHFGEEKHFLAQPRNETQFFDCRAPSLVIPATNSVR